jgi:hypothetical protein
MPLYAFWWAVAVIGIFLAGAANAQEPPSTYFFPDSNAAMAAFIDPHITNETKRQLAQLIESRHWPVEYQDPKTKLIWLYRPGMPPTLEGVRASNSEAKKQKVQTAHGPARPRHELSS